MESPQSDLDAATLLSSLPPMPEPKREEQRHQALLGNVSVLLLTAVCLAAAHGGDYCMQNPGEPLWELPPALTRICLVLVYVLAVVAVLCLLGLMWGDPGVVRRSPDTCWPAPAQVAECVSSGIGWTLLDQNIVEGERTYCIRCHVWRRPGEPPAVRARTRIGRACEDATSCFVPYPEDGKFHHCSVCQRCVAHFDHHCGFFGRCIAGRGMGGNAGYFKMLIGIGQLAVPIAFLGLVAGTLQTGLGSYVGLALAGYAVLVCCCGCTGVSCMNIIAYLCMRCCRPGGKVPGQPIPTAAIEAIGGGATVEPAPVEATVVGNSAA